MQIGLGMLRLSDPFYEGKKGFRTGLLFVEKESYSSIIVGRKTGRELNATLQQKNMAF